MKACEILNLLRVSRPTLTNYVKQGIINVVKLPNGRYDYDEKIVYDFMNKDIPRNGYINADVNGALNTLKKVVGDGFIQNLSNRGCWFQPVRIRDMFQTSNEHILLKTVNIS